MKINDKNFNNYDLFNWHLFTNNFDNVYLSKIFIIFPI